MVQQQSTPPAIGLKPSLQLAKNHSTIFSHPTPDGQHASAVLSKLAYFVVNLF
jgi:hypothetical protein